MKARNIHFCILILGVVFSCSKENSDNSVVYKDINPDIKITSFVPNKDCNTYSAMSCYYLDLNQDGFPDFEFSIKHNPSDSIYRFKDEFHIEVRDISQYLSKYNLLDPKFSTETNTDNQFPFVKLYEYGDTMTDHFIDYNAYLYKVDEEDSLRTEGDFYIGLQLIESSHNGNMNKFYGWIHLEIRFWSVTFKDYAYSTIPNKKLKIGAID